ncbi:MAG: class II fructose-1,6-bisphosphate aldolase [Candidatus Bathyarchaeota archaeon]|nr:MAG: class II fructose-1,6-bisphosphate aldolase [Candidatus Bathyarchaeota archaeon]
MLVSNECIMSTAAAAGYGVGAFNINNLETLMAIEEAAVEEKSPVIVAITPSAIRYGGLDYLASIVKVAAKRISVPVSLHLDHGKDLETITRCLKAGFTSVMIDASHLEYKENVAMTKAAVSLAHKSGASVEAELGVLAGIEEDLVKEGDVVLTDPHLAEEFVKRTKVDALAIAIGTSHGAYKYKGDPMLDFERLKAIRKQTDVLLVLHGASNVPLWVIERATKYGAELAGAKGIREDHIQRAISLGISKINIDTDLRLAFTGAVRQVLATSPKQFDPRKILGPAKEAMKEVAQMKMRLFGSSGKVVAKEMNA